jgi:hypothetical protein
MMKRINLFKLLNMIMLFKNLSKALLPPFMATKMSKKEYLRSFLVEQEKISLNLAEADLDRISTFVYVVIPQQRSLSYCSKSSKLLQEASTQVGVAPVQ